MNPSQRPGPTADIGPTDSEPGDRPAAGDAPRLLYVATVSGTIRHFLLPFARHFRARGWQVEAAASGATQDRTLVETFDRVYDIPLSRSVRDVRSLVRGWQAVAGALASGPDLVHVHTPIAAFVTRVAARRLPAGERPAVAYTAHGFHFHAGGSPLTNAVFATAERIAGRWTDRLVVINDEDEAAARRLRIVPASRLVRMPGIGVDTATYARSTVDPAVAVAAMAGLDLASGPPVFVVVAELSPRKRQADVIRALAHMRHRDARLVLAGGGPGRPMLEALIAELGLGTRVWFAGILDDVRPLVSGVTALILASDREGLARSIMEAMSLEVPVIASTARGNRELVGFDRGLLVPIGNIPELAGAMDWIVEHPDEAREMGRRGRARMAERYETSILIRMHEEMYRDLLSERAERRRVQAERPRLT